VRRLRLQLIGILVLATLLPLLPAAFAARELFRRSLDPLLASGLSEAADAGMAVTRDVLEAHKASWLGELRAGGKLDTLDARARLELQLDGPAAVGTAAAEPLGELLLVRAPEVRSTDSSVVLVARVRAPGGEPVWITRALPGTLAGDAVRITRGTRLLQALRLERLALLRGLEATFLVTYLAMVALVLVLGLVLTSRLTRPLSDLTEGVDRIAAGDLAARVPERGSGEVAELMRHFNAMGERLRSQQSELARLERLATWRQMARFLAHEIKNPLTPIQLAAEQMRDAYRGDDPAYRRLVQESAAIIQEEVHGMWKLVSEFSQFARLPEIRASRVAADDLVRDLVALYGPAQLEAGTGALAAAGAGAIHCDRDQLKRALVNLVDNALAAQASVGRTEPVELSFLPRSGGGVVVRVRDHGPGIPDDRKRRVFEPDYTTKSGGMGMGLAIVESIVLQHGGAIEVLDADGTGAIFQVTLPEQVPAGGNAA
jgi:two-component system, NtrC family, nitrogen regulation sensor histidine kinase NtrY